MGSQPAPDQVMSLPSKELSEQALDTLIARERTRIVAPLTEWHSLAVALRDEGLLHAPGAYESARPAAPPLPRERIPWVGAVARWTVRAAAAVALVGAGIIAGQGMQFGHDIANTIHMAIADSTSGGSHVRVSGAPYASAEEARRALLKSETEYQRAAGYLAASDTIARTATSPEVYRDRLAALDEMTVAAMKALKDAPDDPLLNQYYLSTVAAREATIQQLSHALPTGARVIRF